ncbi:unnamed protein product [Acanthoscelides obtectus]|uniref:Pre-C2HC domain-containing protein n=1 Tax=Acanthoscelides obtectus TaxID=200917 RepID=A0A9P0LZS5_ACAOB|nr:unnamed protein product [Acanthoscelides obtectus]CAK1648817.1 Nucleic-acid-binding protein from transposon X-element [Acanthoscelides obtectus]
MDILVGSFTTNVGRCWMRLKYEYIPCLQDGQKEHILSPSGKDDYRKIVRLFREEEVPHHTFPLPSERNIHAVVRGFPVNFSDTEIKGELEQRGYSPLHIIRLKRSGGAPMPLVVVILPKTEKSQQVFNEHELLGLAIRVEVQKNSRPIGQCHRCQKYGHAQSNCTAPPKCLKCAKDHMTHFCPLTEEEERKCANCGEEHPANSRTPVFFRNHQDPPPVRKFGTPRSSKGLGGRYTVTKIYHLPIVGTMPSEKFLGAPMSAACNKEHKGCCFAKWFMQTIFQTYKHQGNRFISSYTKPNAESHRLTIYLVSYELNSSRKLHKLKRGGEVTVNKIKSEAEGRWGGLTENVWLALCHSFSESALDPGQDHFIRGHIVGNTSSASRLSNVTKKQAPTALKQKTPSPRWESYSGSDQVGFMVTREIQEDLFPLPREYSLAYCVAEDLNASRSLAFLFHRRFEERQAHFGKALYVLDSGRFVYALDIRAAHHQPYLRNLRQHLMAWHVRKLAIPKMEYEREGLYRKTVRNMI